MVYFLNQNRKERLIIMENIKDFINDKMKVLLVINEHLVDIEGIKMCPLNQNELANEIGCSKVKVNGLLRELIDSGYIETPKKGRYVLTSNANEIIKKLS